MKLEKFSQAAREVLLEAGSFWPMDEEALGDFKLSLRWHIRIFWLPATEMSGKRKKT